MHPIDERLLAMNIVLPSPPKPVGNYVAVRTANGIGRISGQFPIQHGKLSCKGIIGTNITIESAQAAMSVCAINVLAQIKQTIGSWENLGGLVHVEGYLVTVPAFNHHPQVLDAASDLFKNILGEQGLHSRAVVGVTSLPFESPVELVVSFYL